MKQLNVVIDVRNDILKVNGDRQFRIKQLPAQSVNNIKIRTEHMSENQRTIINKLAANYKTLFAEPDEKLTYSTKVVGEIRTTSDKPIHTKHYPYPISLKQEVERQLQEMLNDGIIRPSRSPYNAPVWIVPKKVDASGKKKYRIVIDYRKLNAETISDRYPMPEIGEIIAQLGNNKFFTVLDLKSGFHQILLREQDIEKTAFAVNGGKFEFTRLPFGLKNSPSIFQRALDDILRDHIGKICYVYIDDIIIFSKTEEEHANHLGQVFLTLQNANMKVQMDKCEFYKKQVNFLGFTISENGVKTNQEKVKAISDFPIPKSLKELRSFLGLSGYYRRFIRDYAKLAKPLTTLLRGEGGRISTRMSDKVQIQLNQEAIEAFIKLKRSLSSEDVILSYPNFKKEFHLTTDASNFAIGAVLEQEGKPITFISRTLSKTEENYAVNEKEMLAIVWALQSLRTYLYGTAKVVIYTDHQPLTFALSNKNHNGKLKRWKSYLEEFNYELKYKPGTSNVVADALSRTPAKHEINTLSSSATVHSDDSSSHNLIYSVESPINVFKNQLFLFTDDTPSYSFEIPFPTYHRHIVKRPSYTEKDLIEIMKQRLDPKILNGIHTSENIMGKIQNFYPLHFNSYKIRFAQGIVEDVNEEDRQNDLIVQEHKRAHRSAKENKEQIIRKFFFPQMNKKVIAIAKTCLTCKESKYDRHPPKGAIQSTPIPQYPGQLIHIDIYITEKLNILTGIDKFSKYAQVKVLKSRASQDIMIPLREMLIAFGIPKVVVMDNERALNSASIKFMLENQLKISVFTTPPYSSTSNGQVERFHSTLTEILRCLKKDHEELTLIELLFKATQEYNQSIHSITKEKPIETFFRSNITNTTESIERKREEIRNKITGTQITDLNYHNANKNTPRSYAIGEEVYVKINKRLGSKISSRYKKEIVAENGNSTITTKSGKIVHKNNLKN